MSHQIYTILLPEIWSSDKRCRDSGRRSGSISRFPQSTGNRLLQAITTLSHHQEDPEASYPRNKPHLLMVDKQLLVYSPTNKINLYFISRLTLINTHILHNISQLFCSHFHKNVLPRGPQDICFLVFISPVISTNWMAHSVLWYFNILAMSDLGSTCKMVVLIYIICQPSKLMYHRYTWLPSF